MATEHLPMDDGEHVITAYCVNTAMPMPIVRASGNRVWMDATSERFANRCLPLRIGNQAGWWLLNPHKFKVTWYGGEVVDSLRIQYRRGTPQDQRPAVSHFGHGIVTFIIPYLFRTPSGYNMLVRGPANLPKDGIQALDGVVETDWNRATFTMNWMVTRPDHEIVFEKDEPICMIVPQKRGELEAFRGAVSDIRDNAALNEEYMAWANSRRRFLEEIDVPGTEANKQLWQKDYFQGVTPGGMRVREHQTKLDLREFEEK